MADQQNILTPGGKKKLIKELEYLKDAKRGEIREKIQTAKEHGDLKENAEYHEAREEQSFVEGRILQIEGILKEGQVVEKTSGADIVQVGSKVVLEAEGQKFDYSLVGSHEADPIKGLISCDSPIGISIMGKKKGEVIAVTLPRGEVNYKIVEVS